MDRTKYHLNIRRPRRSVTTGCWLMIVFLIFVSVATGCRQDQTNNLPARYGIEGRNWAIQYAQTHPQRYAGSEAEKQAAQWLEKQIGQIGWQVEAQTFAYQGADGQEHQSQNLVVNVPGVGFQPAKDTNAKTKLSLDEVKQRWILIGAHYDTPAVPATDEQPAQDEGGNANGTTEGQNGAADSQTAITPDGIHNNAAAVAGLLVLLRQMKNVAPGYQTRIVFFGAGTDQFAGAKAYLQSLSEGDKANLEAVYNLERIYAGDKVYAHAGTNSVLPGDQKSYRNRRKLYEATDVYYNNKLLTTNDFGLYTNQGIYRVDLFENGQPVLFSEWTTHQSDHTPFDQAGIPIVFIESYEYDVAAFAELTRETTDPAFSVVNGVINASKLDSSRYLSTYFLSEDESRGGLPFGKGETVTSGSEAAVTSQISETTTRETAKQTDERSKRYIDRLENRINNIAFILLESSRRGPVGFDLR